MLEEKAIQLDQCAAVFVTYMPPADIVAKLNEIYAQGVEEIIVVDNTPGDSNFLTLSFALFKKTPQVIRNGKNLGVARALNQGVDLARQLGYRWVVAFDQDTVVATNFFSQMSQIYERISVGSAWPIGVLGANYIDKVLNCKAHADENAQVAVEVREVITSGSLVSVEAFTAVGGFEEKLFIDMVDTEFCFRLRQAGFSVWRTCEPLMEHSLGSLTQKKILGLHFNVTNHLPERRYYIFRNTLYMVGKYKKFDPCWAMRMLCSYLPKTFIKACVFESQRGRNFLFILRGIRDALLSRYDRNYL